MAAVLTLSGLPAVDAELNSRTFPEYLYQADLRFDDGAGIYDPADPDNTCLAFLGFGSLGTAFFYYETARTYTNGGPAADATAFDGVNVPGDGTPFEDCFGQTAPGNHVGLSPGMFRSGYTTGQAALLGIDEVGVLDSTTAWGFKACPVSNAAVDFGPTPASGLVVTANGYDITCSGGGIWSANYAHLLGTGLGFVDTANGAVWLNLLSPPESGHRVVRSCLALDVFSTSTGVQSRQADADYFFVLDATDPGLQNLGSTQALLTGWTLDPNKWPNLRPNYVSEQCLPEDVYLIFQFQSIDGTGVNPNGDRVGGQIVTVTASNGRPTHVTSHTPTITQGPGNPLVQKISDNQFKVIEVSHNNFCINLAVTANVLQGGITVPISGTKSWCQTN